MGATDRRQGETAAGTGTVETEDIPDYPALTKKPAEASRTGEASFTSNTANPPSTYSGQATGVAPIKGETRRRRGAGAQPMCRPPLTEKSAPVA